MTGSSRRDFLKQAALLTAGGSFVGALPASIQRALAIDPEVGSTYLDAEHIVILMQENRSFDHAYGTLQGVRGFNDPRAVTLPNGNPVWFQTNAAGETYAPFWLNIKDTNATWLGYLPHGWSDQSRARNNGWYDRWLIDKRSGNKAHGNDPLTLGYYNRQDIPFYYAFADAFTVCDQNFCSSLTGTTPNRLHLWTGTIRATASPDAKACVNNSEADFDTAVSWKTFPERLEEIGVSWCCYQNELSVDTGLSGEADKWLASYGDNPLEYFTQYGVRFAPRHQQHLTGLVQRLTDELSKLEATPEPWADAVKKQVTSKRAKLEEAKRGLQEWSAERFANAPASQKNLHRKAFVTNEADPDFRELTTITYDDGGTERKMRVPKGDLFHQFRKDVREGKLPAVSWLVAPENFSDHPSSPWYGAWYVSQALDILTQNPDVWKKTIFILCYDENDGYFDHVPPFVPPLPDRPETGKVSAGLDVALEHAPGGRSEPNPIGLGYRVPLVIASPWSRGGYVCSEVFDHTSIIQLIERFVLRKTGKPIRETNISAWRRTVCGDLSSAFRPYRGEKIALPKPVDRDPFLGGIHQAQFKPGPNGFKKLQPTDIELASKEPHHCDWLPRQESGVRPSCALPYRLEADGGLNAERDAFVLKLSTGQAVGAPFYLYQRNATQPEPSPVRFYAVTACDHLTDTVPLKNAAYHLALHGPNGFYREFRGTADDPSIDFVLESLRDTGKMVLRIVNRDQQRGFAIRIEDAGYGAAPKSVALEAAGAKASHAEVLIDLYQSKGWHDLRIRIDGAPQFEKRYAGRIETGRESISDPLMAKAKS